MSARKAQTFLPVARGEAEEPWVALARLAILRRAGGDVARRDGTRSRVPMAGLRARLRIPLERHDASVDTRIL